MTDEPTRLAWCGGDPPVRIAPSLEVFTIGKPIVSGVPCGAYGAPEDVGERIAIPQRGAHLAGHDGVDRVIYQEQVG